MPVPARSSKTRHKSRQHFLLRMRVVVHHGYACARIRPIDFILCESEVSEQLFTFWQYGVDETKDPTFPDYKNRVAKRDEIHQLATLFGVSDKEIDSKIHNLRSQFLREFNKCASSKTSGSG